jgi:membrane protease YdiL (CAAX protease family)
MFRGLLLQFTSKFTKNPIILSIVVGLIFGSIHFSNPEMSDGAIPVGIQYLFVGFMLTYISVKSNTIELSIGIHAANNMFIALFVTSENSVGGVMPSLFLRLNTTTEALYLSLLLTIISFVSFYILAMKRYKATLISGK